MSRGHRCKLDFFDRGHSVLGCTECNVRRVTLADPSRRVTVLHELLERDELTGVAEMEARSS